MLARPLHWKFALTLALCVFLLLPFVASAESDPSTVTAISASPTSTSALGSPGTSERLPLLYALARSGPYNVSGAPGGTTGQFTVAFMNFGLITWSSTNKVQLHSTLTGSFAGLGSGPGSCNPLRPFHTCTWTISYTIASTATPGTYTDHWQMYIGNHPFGQIITGTLTIT